MAVNPSKPEIRVVVLTRKAKPSSVWTFSLRVTNLLPHLEAHNIRVEICQLPTGLVAKHKLLRQLRGYDIAWLHRHLFWPMELGLWKKIARRLVFDYDDPVCYSPKNPGHFSLTRWIKFRATLRRADGVLAATDRLVELAQPFNRRVVLAPLSLDPAGYRMSPSERSGSEPFRILWLGSRSTFVYLESVRPHLEAIGAACRGVELVVVGHSELRLGNMPVHNQRWSPKTEAAELSRCHLGLVPLASNRWAEGKAAMKPLQYMASGLPFLGTPNGGNPRLADGGRNGWLGRSPDEWALAVRQLSRDEERRRVMAGNSVEYIRRHHLPEVRAAHVANLFRQVVFHPATSIAA